MSRPEPIIDDMTRPDLTAAVGTEWEFIADRVMGGVSSGNISKVEREGRRAVQLAGVVSLDNNGGFVQAALDLAPDGAAIDARRFTGIALDVIGNGEDYNLHLRTADLTRPWQSYRQTFTAPRSWNTLQFAFDDFTAHRTDARFRAAQLRRIGILAIGRQFKADIAIGGVRFY